MVTILLIIFFALLAFGAFMWALQYMATHFCPICFDDENGTEETLIPIIPYYRSFCPACSAVCNHSDAVYTPLRKNAEAEGQKEAEESPPTL